MINMMSGGRIPRKTFKKPKIITSAPKAAKLRRDRHAFTDNISGQEILEVENVELRRILIERLGYEKFLEQVGGIVRHRDQDAGGERQLISIPFEDDEPLMVLKVICPSTAHLHILRVPPYMQTCHQAAAWVAGFENPNDYAPTIEA